MAIVLSRDHTGTVKVGNATTCVPTTLSAIAVLANNSFSNGDVFSEDGYVYNNDKRTRKWFVRFSDIERVWGPNLSHSMAEHWDVIYRKYCDRSDKAWNNVWASAQELKNKCGPKLHGDKYCTISVNNKRKVYTISESGIGFSWLDAGRNVLPEFGKLIDRQYMYYEAVNKRKYIIGIALDECIKRRIQKSNSHKNYGVICVNLNGHRYLYNKFQKLVWPDDIAKEV